MTSLFIGDIDPKTTKLDIEATINQHGNFKKLIIKYNKKKSNKMCFFKVYDLETIESLIIRPILIKGVEHYCQISQRPQDERPAQEQTEYEFQRRCVFINNIPRNLTDNQLMEFFSNFGPTESAFSIKKQGRGVGYGFVYFESEHTANIVSKMKKINYKGKFMIAKSYLQKNKADKKTKYPNKKWSKHMKKRESQSNSKEFPLGGGNSGPQISLEANMDQNLNTVGWSGPGGLRIRESGHLTAGFVRPPPGRLGNPFMAGAEPVILSSNNNPDIYRVTEAHARLKRAKHRQEINSPREEVYKARSKYRNKDPYYRPYHFELEGPRVSVIGISRLHRIESNHPSGNLRINRGEERVLKHMF